MSTLIHRIETIVGLNPYVITVHTRVDEVGGSFVVSCDGDEHGHPCSGREDVAIEPGDTWGTDESAVAFAAQHADEHFKREARP